MRLTTATQTEALGLFTTTVRDLQASLTEIETLVADVETLKSAQEALIQRSGVTPEERSPDALSDDFAALITGQHDQTREAVAAAKSDLHLALARLIAQQTTPDVAEQPAQTRPAARPATPAAPIAPVQRPRAQALPPNPFSYP